MYQYFARNLPKLLYTHVCIKSNARVFDRWTIDLFVALEFSLVACMAHMRIRSIGQMQLLQDLNLILCIPFEWPNRAHLIMNNSWLRSYILSFNMHRKPFRVWHVYFSFFFFCLRGSFAIWDCKVVALCQAFKYQIKICLKPKYEYRFTMYE